MKKIISKLIEKIHKQAYFYQSLRKTLALPI